MKFLTVFLSAVCCVLGAISEGVYEWESVDGEKAFYTERILPKWFWYQQRWD